MNLVVAGLWGLAVYAAIGLVLAVAFVIRGVTLVDPAAKGSGPAFRALIIPGVTALWPLMLRRWVRAPAAVRENHS